MRTGVFGGTFDPIHLGHLILAEQCREQAGLEQLLVVERADSSTFSADVLRETLRLGADFPLRYRIVPMPLITLASRDIRRRIAEGRSVRYMIPRALEAYIAEKGLYTAG